MHIPPSPPHLESDTKKPKLNHWSESQIAPEYFNRRINDAFHQCGHRDENVDDGRPFRRRRRDSVRIHLVVHLLQYLQLPRHFRRYYVRPHPRPHVSWSRWAWNSPTQWHPVWEETSRFSDLTAISIEFFMFGLPIRDLLVFSVFNCCCDFAGNVMLFDFVFDLISYYSSGGSEAASASGDFTSM